MARISRKELKRDELLEATKGAEHWVVEHASTLIRIGVVLALVAVVAGGWFWIANRNRERAERLFGEAHHRFEQAQEAGFDDPAELEAVLADFASAARRGGGETALLAGYYQGVVLHRLGRDEEAEGALQRVADAESAPPTLAGTSRAMLAEIYREQGNDDRAIEILEGLIAADPPLYPVDQALLELGKIYRSRGDEAAARAAWQRIVDEFAVRGAADEARRLLES